MTFILTDNFAKEIIKSLDRAYEILLERALSTKWPMLKVEDITAVAMVKTVSEIMSDQIGKDIPPKKKKVGMHAIKSV